MKFIYFFYNGMAALSRQPRRVTDFKTNCFMMEIFEACFKYIIPCIKLFSLGRNYIKKLGILSDFTKRRKIYIIGEEDIDKLNKFLIKSMQDNRCLQRKTKATSRVGINWIRSLIETHNDINHRFKMMGNEAYRRERVC